MKQLAFKFTLLFLTLPISWANAESAEKKPEQTPAAELKPPILETVFPAVEFVETRFDAAMEFVKIRLVDLHPNLDRRLPIMCRMDPKKEFPTITLEFEDVSLGELLDEITKQTKLAHGFEKGDLLIYDPEYEGKTVEIDTWRK